MAKVLNRQTRKAARFIGRALGEAAEAQRFNGYKEFTLYSHNADDCPTFLHLAEEN
jgi:predicted 2-oxoglutarate/Fe(II)-dependent dioxygenase YbiX